MPSFILRKLVRDRLIDEYEKLGQVADVRGIMGQELAQALKNKIIEEAQEIKLSNPESVIAEIADIQQVLDDLIKILDIDEVAIKTVKMKKFEKKEASWAAISLRL